MTLARSTLAAGTIIMKILMSLANGRRLSGRSRVTTRRTPLLLALSIGLAFAGTAAEAHCDKDTETLLRFAISAPPRSFAAWDASAEQFCPRTFVTRDWSATQKIWMMKFDREMPGTDTDAVLGAVLNEFTPVLKSAGYTAKPWGQPSTMGYEAHWEAPGKPAVVIEVVDKSEDEPDDMPGKTLIEIKVFHPAN
jgi:hypothetical protein